MQCPVCIASDLKPTKLDFGLAANTCIRCNGIMVDLLSYRSWLEHAPDDLADNNNAVTTATDTDTAIDCPKCQRLMIKYKISAELDHHIDHCSHCQDAWLDNGEWKLLKHLKIHKNLAEVFSDDWIIQSIRSSEEKHFEERYQSLLGDDDYLFMRKVKAWVEKHPHAQRIIHYLLKGRSRRF